MAPTCCPHMSFMSQSHIFQDRRCSHLVRHMFPCCWFLMGYTRCVSNELCHPSTAGRILPLHSALLLRGEQTFHKTFQKPFDRSVLLLQDAMVSVPTKPFEDLYSRAEATTLHQFQGTFSDTSKGTSLGFTQHPVDLAWYF